MSGLWKKHEEFSKIGPKRQAEGQDVELDPFPEENDALDSLINDEVNVDVREELDAITDSETFERELEEILVSILEFLRRQWGARQRARRAPQPPAIPINLPAPQSPAQRLLATGACVISDQWFTSHVPQLIAQFDQTLRNFPEYRRDQPGGAEPLYVLGGFAALGNASSWHNPFVRFLRLHAMRAVYSTFADVTRQSGDLFMQMADRMLYRPPGVKPMADTWHRDIMEIGRPGDVIYGGWINTSDQDQALSCVLSTQNDPSDPDDPKGFAKITDAARITQYEAAKTQVLVKPGEILIFNERMVHEVLAVKKNYPIRRVFLAWMTSRNIETNLETRWPHYLDRLLTQQAVIPLKSGQMPRMYPKTYTAYFIDKLTQWSVANLRPSMLTTKVQPATAKKLPGQTIQIALAEAPSLTAAGFPLYPAYEQHERDVFVSRRSHMLPVTVGSDQLAMQFL